MHVVSGAVGGLGISILGYLKKQGDVKFDVKKFIPIVIVGAVIGAVAGYQGVDYGAIENASYAGSIALVVTWGWKAVWRKWVYKLFE